MKALLGAPSRVGVEGRFPLFDGPCRVALRVGVAFGGVAADGLPVLLLRISVVHNMVGACKELT